jgi:hypothetical protein
MMKCCRVPSSRILVFSLSLFAAVALGILILLKPQATVNAIQFRAPPEVRTATKGTIPVAIAMIFAFSFLGFDSLPPTWHWGHVNMSSSGQKVLALVGGSFLMLYGIFACAWPLRFASIHSPRLRHVTADRIDSGSMAKVELASRFWGILFLLVSAFLLQQFGH